MHSEKSQWSSNAVDSCFHTNISNLNTELMKSEYLNHSIKKAITIEGFGYCCYHPILSSPILQGQLWDSYIRPPII